MIITLNNTKFFKTQAPNTQARDVILNDILNGFEGNFQTIAKGWNTADFLALYDSVISQFQTESAVLGTVTKHLSWVNNIVKFTSIDNHFNSLNTQDAAYTLRHYIRLGVDHPRTHYIINEQKYMIDNVEENDIVIHPAEVIQGYDQNLLDESCVVLTFTFSIKA
jgi:hypothetical protein